MKNNLEIGIRIRKIREDLKLNREMFSEKVNISEGFLAQLERGEKTLGLGTLVSICTNTGYSSDYILFGKVDDDSNAKRTLRLLNQLPPEVNSIVYSIAGSVKDLYDITTSNTNIKN